MRICEAANLPRNPFLKKSTHDDFAKYVVKNLDGNSLREFGGSLDYLSLVYVENSPQKYNNCPVEFKTDWCGYDKNNGYVQTITISGNSLEEILNKGEAKTPFLEFGDEARITMQDETGRNIFGDIRQKLQQYHNQSPVNFFE